MPGVYPTRRNQSTSFSQTSQFHILCHPSYVSHKQVTGPNRLVAKAAEIASFSRLDCIRDSSFFQLKTRQYPSDTRELNPFIHSVLFIHSFTHPQTIRTQLANLSSTSANNRSPSKFLYEDIRCSHVYSTVFLRFWVFFRLFFNVGLNLK